MSNKQQPECPVCGVECTDSEVCGACVSHAAENLKFDVELLEAQ